MSSHKRLSILLALLLSGLVAVAAACTPTHPTLAPSPSRAIATATAVPTSLPPAPTPPPAAPTSPATPTAKGTAPSIGTLPPTVIPTPSPVQMATPTRAPATSIATVAPTRVPATSTPAAASSPTAAPTKPAPAREFSASSALAHVVALAGDIGPRPAGLPGSERAASYIAAQLQKYGYQVERQTFTFLYFEDIASTLTVLGPPPRQVEAAALVYSIQGEVKGSLVNAGLGSPQDFTGREVAGRIALVKRGEIRFTDKVSNAAQAGAAAIIIYNSAPGTFRGALTGASAIPAVTISGDAGNALLEAMGQREVQVQLSVKTITENRPSDNIVARWPGAGSSYAVVGAHYDSVPRAPGANDNASGVAVLLEVARAMAGTPGVTYIAFGAEEPGLYGSQSYVNGQSAAVLGQLAAMLNLDMVSDGPSLSLESAGPRSDRLREQAVAAARELGIAAAGAVSDGGSDHMPFANRGVPTLHFYAGMVPYYHSPQDTPDKVKPANLEAAGRLMLALLGRLAAQP